MAPPESRLPSGIHFPLAERGICLSKSGGNGNGSSTGSEACDVGVRVRFSSPPCLSKSCVEVVLAEPRGLFSSLLASTSDLGSSGSTRV